MRVQDFILPLLTRVLKSIPLHPYIHPPTCYMYKHKYSELHNKHAANLIIFEKIFPPTCLIRTFTFIYFQEKFLPTWLLEYLCLLILADILNYKIILSSFKLLFCCLSTFKKQAGLKLMWFEVFKSHNLIYT